MSEFTAVQMAQLEETLKKSHQLVDQQLVKMKGELDTTGKLSTENKAALDHLIAENLKVVARIADLEQKAIRMAKDADDEELETIAFKFARSEELKVFTKSGAKHARFEVEKTNIDIEMARIQRKAIINATGQNQPLVPAQRLPGIIAPQERRMTVRNILPVGVTSSNLIEFAKENVFTNSAAAVYSGGAVENVAKAASDITFTLSNVAVVTIAHYILASRQVLDDAPMLQSYIEGRLMYGLKLEEEDELLNGDGTNGTISGLLASGNFTAFNRPTTADDTHIDLVRKGKLQLRLSDFEASAVIMHPSDWDRIEGEKDTQGRYIYGDPSKTATPALWSIPVVATTAITEGTMLIGDFPMAAQVWDRQQMSVELSREHSDNFTKNMVTILAEERLALAVYRPSALIKINATDAVSPS